MQILNVFCGSAFSANLESSVCRIPGFTSSGDNGKRSDDTTARWGTAKLILLSAGLKFPFSVLPTTCSPFHKNSYDKKLS
jgi:hypothetical protein